MVARSRERDGTSYAAEPAAAVNACASAGAGEAPEPEPEMTFEEMQAIRKQNMGGQYV